MSIRGSSYARALWVTAVVSMSVLLQAATVCADELWVVPTLPLTEAFDTVRFGLRPLIVTPPMGALSAGAEIDVPFGPCVDGVGDPGDLLSPHASAPASIATASTPPARRIAVAFMQFPPGTSAAARDVPAEPGAHLVGERPACIPLRGRV